MVSYPVPGTKPSGRSKPSGIRPRGTNYAEGMKRLILLIAVIGLVAVAVKKLQSS